jgi:putative flippase GtrA
VSAPALALRYALFAVLATLANLAVQRFVLASGDTHLAYAAAVAAGTLAGLVLKYLLDKRWIFFDSSSGAAAHGRKFTLYTVMGVVTTAVFWASETIAWLIWHSDLARELGAIAGLTFGYGIKYRLDRRFVFTRPVPQAA